ncbi:MAG: SusC/RagA family TonB-linked outer membrane protein [Sphingobacteriaceae bacterium]|nr:MAG: SusC/RagA family TonB-linked outer membrane protein [Sphingobacteriaceae bacterium]
MVPVQVNDKYLLTSTFRYDGTSNFAPDNRWNFSYAFAFAYRLSQESFLKGNENINDLKLRIGYGLLNNQNVGNYVYGTSFRGVQTGLGLGLLINNLQNPDARWETTKASNIGVDASLLKSRINLTFDAYIKNTDGLLSSLPLPLYSGTTPSDQYTVAQLTAPTKNIGSITNKGFEFSINTENIKSKNFSWNSTITYSQNRNKVTSLVTPNTVIPQYIGTDIISQVSVGRSIGEFYGYQVDGIYKDAADLNTHPRPINNSTGQALPIGVDQIWLGDLKFKDINGDGKIDQNDRVYLGSPIPKFQYGINNTLRYKSFELTFFFNGNYGNKIFNNIKRENEDPRSNFGLLQSVNDFARIGLISATGSATDVNNLYVTNPNTTVPRISSGDANQNTRPSSRYIEDGSYIRLKNAILGYNLPYSLVQKAKLTYVRVYTNVQNVFTVTNYTGYDPEVGSRFQGATSAGIDYGRYPSQRIFTIGLNAGF